MLKWENRGKNTKIPRIYFKNSEKKVGKRWGRRTNPIKNLQVCSKNFQKSWGSYGRPIKVLFKKAYN